MADSPNDAGLVGDVGDGTVCAVKGDETVGIFRGKPPAGPDSGAQQLCAVRHGRASRVGDAIASDMAVVPPWSQAANGPSIWT